eukprot:249015-Prymnesium_polylepis.1
MPHGRTGLAACPATHHRCQTSDPARSRRLAPVPLHARGQFSTIPSLATHTLDRKSLLAAARASLRCVTKTDMPSRERFATIHSFQL